MMRQLQRMVASPSPIHLLKMRRPLGRLLQLTRLLSKRQRVTDNTQMGFYGTAATGLAAAAAAGLGYAYLETKRFIVREVSVPVLPVGQADVRVLHISDLHLTPRQYRKLDWIRSLADLQPDLVINTGDNLAHVDAVEPLLAAMAPLLERPGAFVFGSNDYWAPVPKNPARYLLRDSRHEVSDPRPLPWGYMRDTFLGAGWSDLNNHRSQIALADGRVLALVGTDDAHLDLDEMPAPVTSNAPADGSRIADGADGGGGGDTLDSAPLLHLGVTHAPYLRVLAEFQADGVDMIFAGHTHGGQLCVPGFGALVTNCDLDRGRASGLSEWPGARPDAMPVDSSPTEAHPGNDSVWLHVSAGAGTSPYTPVRFACRPEATLLTLTQR